LNIVRPVLVLSAVLSIGISAIGQGTRSPANEQTEFSAEDEGVKKPITIPEDVLAILRKDTTVRDILEDQGLAADRLPESWFSASEVHLSKGKLKDLIVVAEQPLVGANTVTFWVFRNAGNIHELILTAPAHDLQVKRVRSKGYRDIEMSAETAVEFHSVRFRFDGKRYSIYHEKLEPIR
jgi:hypothetical protein